MSYSRPENINSNYNELEQKAIKIENIQAKKYILQLIDRLKDYKEDYDDPNCQQIKKEYYETCSKAIKCYQLQIDNIKCDPDSKQIIQNIFKSIDDYISHFKPRDKKEDTNAHDRWQEHNLRFQQKFIENYFQTEFTKALKEIKKLATNKLKIPGNIYFVFVEADVKTDPQLVWTNQYVKTMIEHLRLAGLNVCSIHNITNIAETIHESSFVVIIGTEILLNKYIKGTDSLLSEQLVAVDRKTVSEIQKARKITSIPCVLTGSLYTSLPAYYERQYIPINFKGKSYIDCLDILLSRFYSAYNYAFKPMWDSFLDDKTVTDKNMHLIFKSGFHKDAINKELQKEALDLNKQPSKSQDSVSIASASPQADKKDPMPSLRELTDEETEEAQFAEAIRLSIHESNNMKNIQKDVKDNIQNVKISQQIHQDPSGLSNSNNKIYISLGAPSQNLQQQSNAILDTFSEFTQSFIDRCKDVKNESVSSLLKKLGDLSESEREEFKNLEDEINESLPDIPVRLNNHLYDLCTLIAIKERSGLDPITNHRIYLREIQAANDVLDRIKTVIKNITDRRRVVIEHGPGIAPGL